MNIDSLESYEGRGTSLAEEEEYLRGSFNDFISMVSYTSVSRIFFIISLRVADMQDAAAKRIRKEETETFLRERG